MGGFLDFEQLDGFLVIRKCPQYARVRAGKKVMILKKAQEKIDRFNKLGVHYNIVSNYVYNKRKLLNELYDTNYLPYIVAALISFDLERMMGKGAKSKYDIMAGGFATLLHRKLCKIKTKIEHLNDTNIVDINLERKMGHIKDAYKELSAGGKDGLNQKGGDFHVGATKILHFINPELFLIVDSNAARAFRSHHGINYRNTTQPGYTSEKYISCMSYAKDDIIAFGQNDFCALEPGMPMARIYDKLTFATGSDWP